MKERKKDPKAPPAVSYPGALMDPTRLFRRFIQVDGDFEVLYRDVRELVRTKTPPSERVLTLGCQEVGRVLKLFLTGRLKQLEVEQWAEMLEMNDWIDYEEGHESEIAQALFELSSPGINEPLSPSSAQRILGTLHVQDR